MKTNRQGQCPYETPEVEELTVLFSENILSGLTGGASAPEDLEEEDYSGIWNN